MALGLTVDLLDEFYIELLAADERRVDFLDGLPEVSDPFIENTCYHNIILPKSAYKSAPG